VAYYTLIKNKHGTFGSGINVSKTIRTKK